MELFSTKFKQAVQAALASNKVILAVVHAKAKDALITELKQHKATTVYTVTAANREGLPELLVQQVIQAKSGSV